MNQAIGRLRERYSRVGRYYQIHYEAERRALIWEAKAELKRRPNDSTAAISPVCAGCWAGRCECAPRWPCRARRCRKPGR